MTPAAMVRVAVGVVRNPAGEVLVARRAQHQHQGGLWEFPGGKIEPGESLATALARELQEEVNLQLLLEEPVEPWQVIEHDYGDKQVRLEVVLVERFTGSANGKEGQTVEWVPLDALLERAFPAANEPILTALTSASAVPR